MAMARMEKTLDTEREGENGGGRDRCRIGGTDLGVMSNSKAWRSVLV